MIIIPTIGLKNNFTDVEARITEVMSTSKWIQIDVCDGEFANGKTFELELINKLAFPTEDMLWDVHLMVKEPINWVEKCHSIGASRVIGQIEMMSDSKAFLEKVKGDGIEAGLAFDIETPIETISGDWDIILLMGRKAGWGYFEFEKVTLEKITKVKKMGYRVAVDGGVDVDNMAMIEKSGADIVYSEINYWNLINDK